jgi:glutaredoxin
MTDMLRKYSLGKLLKENDMILNLDSGKKYRIYSKDGCPWCVKAKNLLEKLNFNYEVIDLSNDIARVSFYESRAFPSHLRTVPKVYEVIDNKEILIGGYTDLAAKLV